MDRPNLSNPFDLAQMYPEIKSNLYLIKFPGLRLPSHITGHSARIVWEYRNSGRGIRE
jgi:hypothetical protein